MITTSVDPELEQVPKQLSTDTITINFHCGSIGNITGTNLHSERKDEGFKTRAKYIRFKQASSYFYRWFLCGETPKETACLRNLKRDWQTIHTKGCKQRQIRDGSRTRNRSTPNLTLKSHVKVGKKSTIVVATWAANITPVMRPQSLPAAINDTYMFVSQVISNNRGKAHGSLERFHQCSWNLKGSMLIGL